MYSCNCYNGYSVAVCYSSVATVTIGEFVPKMFSNFSYLVVKLSKNLYVVGFSATLPPLKLIYYTIPLPSPKEM